MSLVERIEGASGPDRELDCLIYCATALSHFEYWGGECVLAVQGGFSARLDWEDLPHPTASIDAALMLVPEGCDFMVGRFDNVVGGERPCASVFWSAGDMADEAAANAATPALALCAAALRAREASNG